MANLVEVKVPDTGDFKDVPVIEVLVFAGERNVAAPWLNDKKKVSVRESEFRLECNVLGAEAVCWDLDAYRTPGYVPSTADVAIILLDARLGLWSDAEENLRKAVTLGAVDAASNRARWPPLAIPLAAVPPLPGP